LESAHIITRSTPPLNDDVKFARIANTRWIFLELRLVPVPCRIGLIFRRFGLISSV